MKFDVPVVKTCLVNKNQVFTVRKYETGSKFSVTEVCDIGSCMVQKIKQVESMADLRGYLEFSGFVTLKQWWDKIVSFGAQNGWLYHVTVLEDEFISPSPLDLTTKVKSFNGKYRFLSNFHPSTMIDVDGRSYRSVEHYYQSHKTSDLSIQEEIRLEPTAGKSKKLGRQCVCDIDWDSKKDDVMRYALRMKFTGELKDALISTSPAILEEGNSWGDTYWGICNGEGQNKLGQFLMELRSILEDEFSSPSSLIPGCQYDSNCGKCPHFRPCELRLRVEDYPIKVITFTGNRNLALNDVKKNLQEIHDSNPGTIWVTGMAYGLDLAVAKFAADNGIPFEAHLPFPAHIQISKWDLPTQKLHTALLEKASAVFTHSDKFSMQAYQLRNIKMADKADLVVAFNRNKKGGTVNMINYCKKSKIPIIDGFTHQYFSEGV